MTPQKRISLTSQTAYLHKCVKLNWLTTLCAMWWYISTCSHKATSKNFHWKSTQTMSLAEENRQTEQWRGKIYVEIAAPGLMSNHSNQFVCHTWRHRGVFYTWANPCVRRRSLLRYYGGRHLCRCTCGGRGGLGPIQ